MTTVPCQERGDKTSSTMAHLRNLSFRTFKYLFVMVILVWLTLHLTAIDATGLKRDVGEPETSGKIDDKGNDTDSADNEVTESPVNGADDTVTDSPSNVTDNTDAVVNGTGSTVNGTTTEVNETDTTVNSTDTTVNGTDTTVNGTDTTVNSTDTTVNSTDTTVNETDTTVNGTDTTVNSTDTMVNETDTTMNTTDTTVNGTDTTVNTTETTVNSTDTTVNETDTTVNSTDTTVNGTDTTTNGTDTTTNGTDATSKDTDTSEDGSDTDDTPPADDDIIPVDMKRYRCELEVESVMFNSNHSITWSDELLDMSSDTYQATSHIVTQQLTQLYSSISGFQKLQVTAFSEGSIKILHETHFSSEGPENSTVLIQEVIVSLQQANCSDNQSEPCNLGPLEGLNLTTISIQAVAPCINETLNSCDVNTTVCVSGNDDGTYQCNCTDGYQSTNQSVYMCQDIDECVDSDVTCNVTTSRCENIPGSFECICLQGYEKKEGVCVDIDECTTDSHDCNTTTSECKNSEGSYSCPCLTGYTDIEGVCTDPCDTAGCQHTCVKPDGLTPVCECQAGYSLMPDNKTCSDIDECLTGTLCQQPGQYCTNQPGTYQCDCIPGYLSQGDSCVSAPKKFLGTVEVESVMGEDSEPLTWSEELANKSSTLYKTTEVAMKTQLEPIFSKLQGFVAVHIKAFSQGSIQTDYEVYFDESGPDDSSELESSLAQEFVSSGCSTNYSVKCDLGTLQGLDLNLLSVTASDPCAASEDNNCDVTSTECVAAEDGSYSCTCKEGFKHWPGSLFMCTDLDECADNTHACNVTSSMCNNTLGSYECSCLKGYMERDGKCLPACEPNPCQNEGRCEDKDGDYICRCQGIWTGKNCDEEHDEAMRFRLIAILVGVLMGLLCFVLLVGLLLVCCGEKRSRSSKRSKRDMTLNEWEYERQQGGEYQAINAADDKPHTQVSSFNESSPAGHDNRAFQDGSTGKHSRI